MTNKSLRSGKLSFGKERLISSHKYLGTHLKTGYRAQNINTDVAEVVAISGSNFTSEYRCASIIMI